MRGAILMLSLALMPVAVAHANGLTFHGSFAPPPPQGPSLPGSAPLLASPHLTPPQLTPPQRSEPNAAAARRRPAYRRLPLSCLGVVFDRRGTAAVIAERCLERPHRRRARRYEQKAAPERKGYGILPAGR